MRSYPPKRNHEIKVTMSDSERREAEEFARHHRVSLAAAIRMALAAEFRKVKSRRAA